VEGETRIMIEATTGTTRIDLYLDGNFIGSSKGIINILLSSPRPPLPPSPSTLPPLPFPSPLLIPPSPFPLPPLPFSNINRLKATHIWQSTH
jgi:hypothetical protein